uniref:Uncharacterized protein n=1 Tax=Chromera velia CCMP2878 TaxID=1169474 RepID=A0A0G4ID98_9ALVE|mmetsp:Transcript_12153/g.23498  ORF Transcript_12153/g.23498 Transcript_12153/m.23498 type:complete len:399 (+) Transcript_12153:195-1391(+)|eukprot:Cvel_13319.t1-p1 / transcript=Cvel_13319.t1 / gene=Cvel_13319 / organism=Chromera_velia_CCMP2878 / gene_product=hypothetical protein / transcript_product=hypothetical protein / location=Cvel_scaffold904:20117-21310(-) / protein_length=398 / sequence_SO=supercontig / SO=protein_coding / is_pseudo=false
MGQKCTRAKNAGEKVDKKGAPLARLDQDDTEQVLKAIPHLPPPNPTEYMREWNEEVEEEKRIQAAGGKLRAKRIPDKMVNIPAFRIVDLRERGMAPWKPTDEEMCPMETELGLSLDRDLIVEGAGIPEVNGRYYRDKDFKWRGMTVWHHNELGPGLWKFGGDGVGMTKGEDRAPGVTIFYDLCDTPYDSVVKRKQDGHGKGTGLWCIFFRGCRRYVCERPTVLVTRPSKGVELYATGQYDQMLPPATGWKLGDTDIDESFPPKISGPPPRLSGCGVTVTDDMKKKLATKLKEYAATIPNFSADFGFADEEGGNGGKGKESDEEYIQRMNTGLEGPAASNAARDKYGAPPALGPNGPGPAPPVGGRKVIGANDDGKAEKKGCGPFGRKKEKGAPKTRTS